MGCSTRRCIPSAECGTPGAALGIVLGAVNVARLNVFVGFNSGRCYEPAPTTPMFQGVFACMFWSRRVSRALLIRNCAGDLAKT